MLGPRVPDLQSLDLFLSVVEEGSLSRAAAAHQISQPSATARIRQLERVLGVDLLDRSPSGSSPTAAGVLVANWGRALLIETVDLQDALSALSTSMVPPLRIAVTHEVAESALPIWLEAFSQTAPEISIRVNVENGSIVRELVENMSVQLGIIDAPVVPGNLHSQLLVEDELVLVVAPSHTWSSRRSITKNDLDNGPLLSREKGSGTRYVVDRQLGAGRRLGHASVELGSPGTVREAALRGLGAGFVSRRLVAGDLERGDLIDVEVAGFASGCSFHAVWVTSKPQPEPVKAFVEMATRTSFGQVP